MGKNSVNKEHLAFCKASIATLRRPGYKGIHSVFSGYNGAFREHFPGVDPVAATQALVDANLIVKRPVKGGVLLYLPGEAPVTENKALEKVLAQLKRK